MSIQFGYDSDISDYISNASIFFDEATIINSSGEFRNTNTTSYGKLCDDCCVVKFYSPFKIYSNQNLTLSGTLSVDTYSYYDNCYVDANEKHGLSVRLNDDNNGCEIDGFFEVKYVDEDGNVIDTTYYLDSGSYDVLTANYNDSSDMNNNVEDEFACLAVNGSEFDGTASGDTTVVARESHDDDDSNGYCDNCGKQVGTFYTVTFDSNGGSAVDPQSILEGNAASKPTDPEKSGFTFEGWYTDADLTVEYDFDSPVTGDITLYAKWETSGSGSDDDDEPTPTPTPDPTPTPTPTPTPNPTPSTPTTGDSGYSYSYSRTVAQRPKLELKATVKGTGVTLTWNNISKAKSYTVYQYKNGKYVKLKETEGTSFTVKYLKKGETYKFLVRYNLNGRLSPMSYSGKVTVTLANKPAVTASSTENSVRLKWTPVNGAEKYAVYKYVNGKAVKLAETEKTSVRITNLKSDTEYSYIIRAYIDGEWTTMTKSDIVTVKTK